MQNTFPILLLNRFNFDGTYSAMLGGFRYSLSIVVIIFLAT